MKNLSLILFFILITSHSIFSQTDNIAMNFRKSLNRNNFTPICINSFPTCTKSDSTIEEVRSISDLRNKGIIFSVLGAGITAGGIVAYANSYSMEEDGFGYFIQRGIGIILMTAGGMGMAGGVVMILVGQNKIKKSKSRTSLHISPLYTSFTYRF